MTPARTSNVLLGVALVVAGAFLISVQDVIVKGFNGVLPLWQIFVLRGVFTAPLIIVFAWAFRSETFDMRAVFERWTLLRAASMSLGLFLFYIALPFISLATAGAGIYLAPVFLTIMSARIAGGRG